MEELLGLAVGFFRAQSVESALWRVVNQIVSFLLFLLLLHVQRRGFFFFFLF